MARLLQNHLRMAILQFLCVSAIVVVAVRKVTAPVQVHAQTVALDNSTSALVTHPASTSAGELGKHLRIRQLRETLALRNEDIAAMGCTRTQAENIFSALSSWTESNAETLEKYESECAVSEQQLAAANRSVNVGPANALINSRLLALQQASLSAKARSRQYLENAANEISLSLSSAQQTTWAIARANAAIAVPSYYRYSPGVSSQDARQLMLEAYRGINSPGDVSNGITLSANAANLAMHAAIGDIIAAEQVAFPNQLPRAQDVPSSALQSK